MANTYIRLNLATPAGSDDKKLKISNDDILAAFLEDKMVSASAAILLSTLNPGGDEDLQIDLDETQIDHNNLLNYDIDEHRTLDDASTTTTSLWSSDKIQTELDLKINAATPMTDNKLVKSIGTSGIDVEATGIDVDDSNNVTGVNDLTIDGDLTVNGTTTSVNTTVLETTDANITVNNGGNQASADTQDAGITVEMSDATDAAIGYDSTTTSKFRAGEVGSTHEIITTNHAQTVINKTINADNNTLSELETDNLKTGVLETDLNNAVDNTNIAGAQAIKDYVAQELATQDEASEITYDNTTSGLTATDTQAAIDETEGRLDTAESTLSSHIGAGTGKHAASQIINTPSGNLAATDVQGALDELQTDVDTRALDSDLTDHIGDTVDAHDASAISNVPAGNIASVTVQAAIDELDSEKYIAADFNTDYDTRLGTKTTDDLTEGVTNLYFSESLAKLSSGDLAEASFNLAESASGASVTGFTFANATVRSFEAIVSIEIDATADLYEEYTLKGIQKGASWDLTASSRGDDTLISFDINASGQIIYDSSTYAGFTAGSIKFRALTTTV